MPESTKAALCEVARVLTQNYCDHKWIGNICTHCGVAYHIWIEDEVKLLRQQRDQALAACAEMRGVLFFIRKCCADEAEWDCIDGDAVNHALSTNCGRGWFNTEQFVEYLQHKPLCEWNDAESPMCTCGLNKLLEDAK